MQLQEKWLSNKYAFSMISKCKFNGFYIIVMENGQRVVIKKYMQSIVMTTHLFSSLLLLLSLSY